MKAARLTAAGAVLLALGAIAGAAQLAGPGSPGPARATAPPRLVAVTSAVRACPPIPGGGPGTVAFIARPSPAPQAGPGQAGPGQDGPGQAELAPLPSADAALRA